MLQKKGTNYETFTTITNPVRVLLHWMRDYIPDTFRVGVIMKMTLEKEFVACKAARVFFKVVENLEQYNTTIGIVDLPEFCKPQEDKITTQADQYVTRLINENRLDEEFCRLYNV